MSNYSVHHDDIPDDPKEAFDAFCVAWRRYQMGAPWTSVSAAYLELKMQFTKPEMDQLWKKGNAMSKEGSDHPLTLLYAFGEERSRLYRLTPQYRERQREYDRNRAKTEKRRDQIKKAKAKHRAKKKAERLGALAKEVA